MGYGRIQDKPKGALIAFSVDTIEDAQKLLVLTCPKNLKNQFVAPELAREQTLENLYSFGNRLQETYRKFVK